MNRIQICIFIIFVQCIIIYSHDCIHDQHDEIIDYHAKYSDYFFKNAKNQIEENQENKRQLQTQQPQQIRITVDYSPIYQVTPSTINTDIIQYLKKLVSVSINYLQNLLKVIPTKGNNIFPKNFSTQCFNVVVPSNDVTKGIPNSDLHLYISYFDNPLSSVLSNASFCAIDSVLKRPNFGRIQYNIGILKGQRTNQKFENHVETTVHEMLHVLGFSQFAMVYWINPETNDFYGVGFKGKILKTITVRGIQTDVLFSNNVLKTARKYYNCDSMEGMHLENQGGSGSVGSHWKKIILLNEIMTAEAIQTNAVLSIFTIALLKDTGFYADINENMATNINWGRNKSCEFVNKICKSTTQQYPEFVSSQSAKGCNSEGDGYGTGISSITMEGCFIISPYNNKICNQPENNNTSNNKYTNERLETFSLQSRCLNSSASSQVYWFSDSSRCHQVRCAADYSSVTIIINQVEKEYTCTTEGSIIDLKYDNNTSLGTITCPSNFKLFCGFQVLCKNSCSSNGFCVNGYCLCLKGFAGEDCSLQCPNFSQNGICVQNCTQGNFAAIDNTCRPFCPVGYYQNNGICSPCHSSCSQCNGPLSNQCTNCQFLTYLDGSTCVSQCSQGKFANEINKTCTPCQNGCLNCVNSTSCLSCETSQGYFLQNDQCIKIQNQCPSTCAYCSPQNNSICTKCILGYLLDTQTGQCVTKCPVGFYQNVITQTCASCSRMEGCIYCKSRMTCTVCNSQLGYRIQLNGRCTLCAVSCFTCQQDNINKCLSCEEFNQYLYNFQCVNSCPVGTYPDNVNQICANCMQGCLQCQDQNQCIQCDKNNGYFLQNGQCIKQQCNPACQKCTKQNLNYCITCNNGKYAFYGQCYDNCPEETYADQTLMTCQWCLYGCLQCNDAESCVTCDENLGWKLYKNNCYTKDECYSPCKTCEPYKPDVCLT